MTYEVNHGLFLDDTFERGLLQLFVLVEAFHGDVDPDLDI